MKRALVFLLFFLSFSAFAEHTVEPFWHDGDASCNAWGYTNIVGSTDKKDVSVGQFRLRLGCTKGPFSSLVETDIAGFLDSNLKNPSYLSQAWVAYTHKEPLWGSLFSLTMLRGGRFQTAGSSDVPGMFYLPTIMKPESIPYSLYGTGVQISTQITSTLRFVADITDRSGLPFPINKVSNQNWVETSQWIGWKITPELLLSLSNQSSSFFQRNGIGAKYTPSEDLMLMTNAFVADEHFPNTLPSHYFGGYAVAEYILWKFEEPRVDVKVLGMIDGTSGTKNYRGVTGGLTLELPENAGWGRLGGSGITGEVTHSTKSEHGGPEITDDTAFFRVRIAF